MSKEEEYEYVYTSESAWIEFYLTNICGEKPEVARQKALARVKKQKEVRNER